MAVDGTYQVTIEAMGKRAHGTVTVEERGGVLTGNVQALGQTIPIQDGRLKGNAFTGVVEGSTPMGKMRAKVTGEVSGDSISGKLRAGLISASFSGARV